MLVIAAAASSMLAIASPARKAVLSGALLFGLSWAFRAGKARPQLEQ